MTLNEIVQSLKKQNNLLEESNQIQAECAQLEKEQLRATKEQTFSPPIRFSMCRATR